MYNLETLYTCLQDVVGFQQADDPDIPTLDADLIVSESGLTFQQEHPLVDLKIIKAVVDEFSEYQYNTYNAATSYTEGERVRINNINYEWSNATPSTPGTAPPDPDWVVVDLFNPFLRNMRKQAIAKVLMAYKQSKQVNEITKTQIDRVRLYDTPGRINQKEVRQGRFVGLEITGVNENGLLIILNRLGTQFDTIQAAKTFYVFHPSHETPIYTITVDIGKANTFEWHTIEGVNGAKLELDYFDSGLDAGGPWYIGYFEDDFSGQAIRKTFDWNKGPCGTCTRSDYKAYRLWTSWMSITPFVVQSGNLNGTNLWDVADNIYVQNTNFGLNLDVSVKCDLTDIFCTQRESFSDAISKQFAVEVAREIVYSSRLNRLEERHRKTAMVALESDDNNMGLRKELDMAMKALSFDFSELGKVCLPCHQNEGIQWGSI